MIEQSSADKFRAFFKLAGDINDELCRQGGRMATATERKLLELKKRWDAGDIAEFINGLPMNWQDECHELFAKPHWPAIDKMFHMPANRRAGS